MIAIRAEEQEIEISGTLDELLEIGLTITALVSSCERSVHLVASTHDPSPYPRILSSMILERSSGPTLVSATDDSVIVTGSDNSLLSFASWFEFPASAGPGYHHHFEPFPDDPDHSADSVPLIVMVRHAGV